MLSDRIKRSIELTKLVARLGIKELTSGDLKARIEQAKILTESLSKLRGAAMKAGQLLSLDLDDYFPPEAIEILSQLQNKAFENPKIHLPDILNAKLSKAQLKTLTEVEEKPFAAASMGQVHRAKHLKQPIVIKVQYPGLQESVHSDLQLLRTVFSALCFITGRQMNLDSLFKEMEDVLLQEVNYLTEAKHTKAFSQKFSKQNWEYLPVRAPKVIDELTQEQLLFLSYEQGITLKEWTALERPLAKREAVAKTLLDLYMLEFFAWGQVQTDPNPSNFLVDEKTFKDIEIVALDFGATKIYPLEFRKTYVGLLKAIRSGSPEKILEHMLNFNLDPRENDEAKQALVDLIIHGTSPFESSIFDFSDDAFIKENNRLSRALIQKLKYTPPPHRLIFLHRKLGGIFAILRKLKVKIELKDYWERTVNQSFT